MEDFKNPVFSLNVIGPMGDDTQEFQIGTNDEKTVAVKIGTIILQDDGHGALKLNDEEVTTSEAVDQIAEDVLNAAKDYTNTAISAFTSFDIIIVEELPQEGDSGAIYLVPKGGQSSGYKEYLYVNDAWEEVGDTDIDLEDYMPKSGGEFTGSIIVDGDITVNTVKSSNQAAGSGLLFENVSSTKIKLGDAVLTLAIENGSPVISIAGSLIRLNGDVYVNGDIIQNSTYDFVQEVYNE